MTDESSRAGDSLKGGRLRFGQGADAAGMKPLGRLSRAELQDLARLLVQMGAVGGWQPLRLLKALTWAVPADRRSFIAVRSLLEIVPAVK